MVIFHSYVNVYQAGYAINGYGMWAEYPTQGPRNH